ncbi:phage protease [soil metagenome]
MGGVENRLALVAVAAAAAVAPGAVQAVACSAEIELIDGKVPTRIKLLPMGAIEMRDGRGPYRIRDMAHAQQVVAATQAFFGSADMPGDRDHQMLHAVKPGVGGTAPATAWVKTANLTAEADGIYANDVTWTDAAAAQIEAREYRYISPLFMAAKDGGDVIHLKNFALVNIGAIDLPAIAASLDDSTKEENHMELTALAALLGLAADSTAEQVAAAIGDLKKAPASTSAIAIAAGLAETAGVEEIAAAVTTLKAAGEPDPAKYVPLSQFTDVTAQLGKLNGERAEREVAAAMAPGVGKVTPAMKAWALDYFVKDEAGYKSWLAAAPQIVAAGSILEDRKPGEQCTTLTADEVAACAAIGMSHEDFLKAKNEEIA